MARTHRKRPRVMEAAREVFFEHGFENTSIDAIATAAGVSRTTVYSQFGNKETLFRAILSLEADNALEAATFVRPDGATQRQDLVTFGRQYLAFVTRPEIIAFDRLIKEEALRAPDFIRHFLAAGPERIMSQLVDMFVGAKISGLVAPQANPKMVADDFVCLLIGPLLLQDRYGLATAPTTNWQVARADHAVDAILSVYGA